MPQMFHPARPGSGLERTKGWRWSPGGTRLVSGGSHRSWVAFWPRGLAPRYYALQHCSLVSWGLRSAVAASHSKLPGGAPPQHPHPETDGR